jgi:hypothetical protein
MKRMIWSAIIAGFAAGFLVIVAQAQPSYDHLCDQGYVEREAYPGDDTCVTRQTRAQAAYDNEHACEHVDPEDPGGALYGGCGTTCLPGYVWRLARPSDHICVTPETRVQTDYDNSQWLNRLAHRYDNPMWFDHRLDWCRRWGTQCGQPAADNYCKRNLWTGARNFEQDPNIGAAQPTITSGSFRVCDQSLCNGFKSITCYGRIANGRKYTPPQKDGHLLDTCLRGDSECGKPAADAFCRYKGFTESFYHLVLPELVPSHLATITIGDGRIYQAEKYDLYAFYMIICQ